MKQVIEQIKAAIAECEAKGKMFNLPSLNRTDVKVNRIDTGSHGSVLTSDEYNIVFDNGDWIKIIYESKDKDRTFQINPDRSVVTVTCSDPSLNFTDGWDEKLF